MISIAPGFALRWDNRDNRGQPDPLRFSILFRRPILSISSSSVQFVRCGDTRCTIAAARAADRLVCKFVTGTVTGTAWLPLADLASTTTHCAKCWRGRATSLYSLNEARQAFQ
jgi:hypothetical protein